MRTDSSLRSRNARSRDCRISNMLTSVYSYRQYSRYARASLRFLNRIADHLSLDSNSAKLARRKWPAIPDLDEIILHLQPILRLVLSDSFAIGIALTKRESFASLSIDRVGSDPTSTQIQRYGLGVPFRVAGCTARSQYQGVR